MTKTCGIYKITNNVNGNFYIGSSNDIRLRWINHKHLLRRGISPNTILQSAWNKYGEDVFQFSIVIKCDPQDLVFYEQKFIDEMSPKYNAALDVVAPMQGRKHSEETKAKIGDAHRGMIRPIGTGAKIANILFGRKASDEARANISAGLMGNQYTKGHKASEETKAKMREAHKGQDTSKAREALALKVAQQRKR
jgi:group I intron endonuclease